MNYIKAILLFFLCYGCKPETKQTFRSEVEDLFFRADMNDSYQKNLQYFKTHKKLKEAEPEGYTIYPPLSALGQEGRDTSFHSFVFEDHPSVAELNGGRLNISKQAYNEKIVSDLVIFYRFKSRNNSEKTFQELINKFSGLASKTSNGGYPNLKYFEFYDSSSNFPGLRISLDNLEVPSYGYTLTISIIR